MFRDNEYVLGRSNIFQVKSLAKFLNTISGIGWRGETCGDCVRVFLVLPRHLPTHRTSPDIGISSNVNIGFLSFFNLYFLSRSKLSTFQRLLTLSTVEQTFKNISRTSWHLGICIPLGYPSLARPEQNKQKTGQEI